MKTREMRKTVTGVVVSDKMDKSVLVEAHRRVKHARYGKYLRKVTKYMAHNPNNEAHMGDRVQIMQARPLSKRKAWRVAQILEKAGGVD